MQLIILKTSLTMNYFLICIYSENSIIFGVAGKKDCHENPGMSMARLHKHETEVN